MTIAEPQPPTMAPIRTDETGAIYVPLYPTPGMRSVPIGVADALILWTANARNAQRAAANGDVPAWTAATMDANFYLGIAIELEPTLTGLRHFPLPEQGEGEV